MKSHSPSSSEAVWVFVRLTRCKFKFLQPIFGLIAIIMLIFLAPPVRGQDSPITVQVNKTNFSTDELVILTVAVSDDSALQPRPILPHLDGLAVIDLDISTDVSVVDGKIHTEVTYTYRLQPRRTGLLTIPPVTVKIDDKMFKAAPISIKVNQGAPPVPSSGNAVSPDNLSPPAELTGQDFFIESQVDLPTPYVGQQIIYTFRFYQAIQIYRQPQFDEPLFTGFETIGLPVREYNFDIQGRTYLITEIRTALFPTTPGQLVIHPARLMFPGNIYEEPVELYTEPVTVEVKSLPNNAPADFNGAVGQFEIKAWFSPQVAVTQQPSTLYVAISGAGNIQTLPEPIWPELTGWRVYDSLSSLTTDTKEDGSMTGTRVYERLVVADQVGDFVIPPATLVYFDPILAKYRTIATNPLSVKVIPVPTLNPTNPIIATPANAIVIPGTPVPVDQSAHPILTNSASFSWPVILPVVILVVGVCGLIPVAAILGAGGAWFWQQRQASSQKAMKEADLQQPNQKIHPALGMAMKDSHDNYKTVSRALTIYLTAALGNSTQGLTRTELINRLRQQGLETTLIKRIEDCLGQSDLGRYGPTRGDAGWSLMAETDELLHELDRVLGK